jgi:alpha-galactosidase
LNLSPLFYWDARDPPDRRGVSQLKHVEGLYAVADWLRARHPDVILEGCASGGRRIDLEMARRFHTFLLSDHNADPSIVRFNLFGINHFLPGNYHQAQSVLPPTAGRGFPPDDLSFQSLFGGSFGTGGRIDLWPEEAKQRARAHLATWKKLRRYLAEDYYSLSEQPADEYTWSGWQFHDPAGGSGFVQTFRTNTAASSHRFKVRGLQEFARYRFTDAYGASSFEVSGAVAMTQGIEVKQAPMSSRVYLYTPIEEDEKVSRRQGAH